MIECSTRPDTKQDTSDIEKDRDLRERLIRLVEPCIRRGHFANAHGYINALESLWKKTEAKA